MTLPRKTVFITGASRGLGRATALLAARQGFDVFATVRSRSDLRLAPYLHPDPPVNEHPLVPMGEINLLPLDVEHPEDMPPETREALLTCDILINNAGIGADVFSGGPESIFTLDPRLFERAIRVNAEGALALMSIAVPQMQQRGWGRVVNVSSLRGQISEVIGDGMSPAYRLSKLLLNGITALAAHEVKGSGVLINSLCPGWCQTDMGGMSAPDTAEQGAERIMALANLPDDGPTGKFFSNSVPVDF